ncbi:hypothetical protein IV57_GL000522 [Companilactobacillus kimchiensis]|uniref:S-layer protein C-terminal domain-containing protein n=2 Tax=Companilactobacillus kimchiensis TaxID=993692 RepID=A0A0R2LB11_9LACO|nr:hypothetical protein IV57_GL000522 [Companilactobacillus kimchiensis]
MVQKSLLIASLLAVGASATTFTSIINPNTVKAEVNSTITNATVTITVPRAQLYAQNGTPLDRGLTQGTAWHVDSQASTAIGNLYRVSTNAYVRASDVNLLINTPGIAENNHQGMGQILMRNYNLKITAPQAKLYDMNGNVLSHALTQDTTWKVGIQNNIPSGTYYSVSTNEYVKASDVYLYSTVQAAPKQTITITTNYAAPVSNQYGQIIPGRYLPAYTSWATDHYTVINNVGYHRVSTNEYVNDYYVR